MIWIHLLFAVLVAVAFTAILWAIERGNAYQGGGLATATVLFATLLLTTWAGGIWLNPVGPRLFGAEWMPFLLIGFVVALLIAAMSPVPRARGRVASREAAAAEEVVTSTVTAFFWIFAICLVAAITLYYAYHDPRNAGQQADRQISASVREANVARVTR